MVEQTGLFVAFKMAIFKRDSLFAKTINEIYGLRVRFPSESSRKALDFVAQLVE